MNVLDDPEGCLCDSTIAIDGGVSPRCAVAVDTMLRYTLYPLK
jgi:hypothetical protein